MSDTLISFRPGFPVAPVPHSVEQRTAPMPSRSFVEVLEATPAPTANAQSSLLDLINALLLKESVSKEELLALRARLRRYASQVNVLASQLRALQRAPAPSSTSSSLAPSTSSSCHIA